ncbi:hypothetical protein A2783_02625 [Microgenomates group bacterium RIFCSPHIGHO2_01_FULL_45_11]|nr:MAG: hypothetical protein A2783_02625 [Microgenomates group bacterium RIFCSPHIGHO2_01_FULL_45_11]
MNDKHKRHANLTKLTVDHDDERDEQINKDQGKEVTFSFWVGLAVILLALIPRFFFLFFKTDIQTFGSFWYGDVFHHWLIGYLTKEIGLHQGFLRLWDLKGLEYYWGILHPLLLVVLFTLTRSADILIVRLVSLVSGVISIALIYLIVCRYWNRAAAWGAVILTSLSPIGIFTDASGMTDPLSTMLMLIAIYVWPKRAFLAGIFLGLSALNRAEYWLFSAGLVFLTLFLYRNWDKRLGVFAGWLAIILPYMKYLLDWTGNAIYPVWTNFFATAKGEWFEGKTLTAQQLLYTHISQGIFIATFLVTALIFWQRPKAKWIWFFGLMNIGFVSFMLGFTAYKESWMDRIWVDRLMNWPQMFVSLLLAVLLLYWLPRQFSLWRTLRVGWLAIIALVLSSQLLWQVIAQNGGFVPYKWWFFRPLAKIIAESYQGGSILVPTQADFLAYALYKYNGIEGKNLVGQMFGPFFYIEGDAFTNWEENKETVKNFFRQNDIRLMIVSGFSNDYRQLAEQEPTWFTKVNHFQETTVFSVHLDRD